MKKVKVIKGIISYVLALILAIAFALYLNANVGWFMLIALILAPVLSVFFAWITSKSIVVTANMIECVMAKGEKYKVEVKIRNKFIFPTTPIELVVLNGDGVRSKEKNVICSTLPVSTTRVNLEFCAKISGPSMVGVKEVRVTDYLGLMSFKLKSLDAKLVQKKVSVIPDVADISLKDDRILKVMHVSQNVEDDEDTVETAVNTFGGFPGYDSREYVPGDPLKRINWKQSAKRDKLLVRLDDEMVTKSVTIILDSVFTRYGIDVSDEMFMDAYGDLEKDEILPKVAEDAVENSLGIIRSLVMSGYTVDFYVKRGYGFTKYEIEDDKDVESVRLSMADYAFLKSNEGERFPKREINLNDGGMIISTPCSLSEIYTYLENELDASKTSIFSSLDDINNGNSEDTGIKRIRIGGGKKPKKKLKHTMADKVRELVVPNVIPFLLALVLSMAMYGVYNITPLSGWTILEILVVAASISLCAYANSHKLAGGLSIVGVVIALLVIYGTIFRDGKMYMQWFVSGGDVVENNPRYLLSLAMVFTVFFTMVIYYYTVVYYRTSALLLVSIIPFILYVKVIKDIDIKYVMLVIALNVIAFLINTRKKKDSKKRIIGNRIGIASLCLYAAVFVMIAVAVPKSEDTKYYYLFEEYFLGGNTTVDMPEQYMKETEFSGDAEGFNELTNRKLYELRDVNETGNIYIRRQVFDYYDFENNRWYKDSYYSGKTYELDRWGNGGEYYSNELLAEAYLKAEEYSSGILDKYKLSGLKNYNITENPKTMTISAENYESQLLVAPLGTFKMDLSAYGNLQDDKWIRVSKHGVFMNDELDKDERLRYRVTYYNKKYVMEEWIGLGGSNLSSINALSCLSDVLWILKEHNEELYVKVVDYYLDEINVVTSYDFACQDNNKEIPQSIKDLAAEITDGLTYDWEKAKAIETYFHDDSFVYDLDYKASDDSVEYFIFESKRGTCSDYATAYVLLARVAGLTVRYVEGFVPEKVYGGASDVDYVIRTKTSHAYPEVYIQNLGYVVYEPTSSFVESSDDFDAGAVMFVMTLGFRIFIIFTFISILLSAIIFIVKVLIPIVRERKFMSKINMATPNRAVVMVYNRLIYNYSEKKIANAAVNTPSQYRDVFMKECEYDVSNLALLVEKSVFEGQTLNNEDKKKAIKVYLEAKKALKTKKKR